jgi:hypothetical protein
MPYSRKIIMKKTYLMKLLCLIFYPFLIGMQSEISKLENLESQIVGQVFEMGERSPYAYSALLSNDRLIIVFPDAFGYRKIIGNLEINRLIAPKLISIPAEKAAEYHTLLKEKYKKQKNK